MTRIEPLAACMPLEAAFLSPVITRETILRVIRRALASCAFQVVLSWNKCRSTWSQRGCAATDAVEEQEEELLGSSATGQASLARLCTLYTLHRDVSLL
jgi:hypothetical protein